MTDDPDQPSPEAFVGVGLVAAQLNFGGIVYSAELAVKIAELLCEAHRGKDELERQRPLTAVDKGTYWQVEGSWNRDRRIEGPGAVFISIEKFDGRVRDIGAWLAYEQPSRSVREIIDRHSRRSESDSTE